MTVLRGLETAFPKRRHVAVFDVHAPRNGEDVGKPAARDVHRNGRKYRLTHRPLIRVPRNLLGAHVEKPLFRDDKNSRVLLSRGNSEDAFNLDIVLAVGDLSDVGEGDDLIGLAEVGGEADVPLGVGYNPLGLLPPNKVSE